MPDPTTSEKPKIRHRVRDKMRQWGLARTIAYIIATAFSFLVASGGVTWMTATNRHAERTDKKLSAATDPGNPNALATQQAIDRWGQNIFDEIHTARLEQITANAILMDRLEANERRLASFEREQAQIRQDLTRTLALRDRVGGLESRVDDVEGDMDGLRKRHQKKSDQEN